MSLASIAEQVGETTIEQTERDVATIDVTATPLVDRLAPVSVSLPCESAEAATLIEAYIDGKSIEKSSYAAGIAPITGAKTLHLLGEPIAPITPTGRAVVRDWINGECLRTEALSLCGASEAEFNLAVFVEMHDPIPEAREVLAGEFERRNPGVTKREELGETMSSVDELL